ncbi:hypothetical protein [Myxococcus sp. RHSTA-1-4]|uniref:hypothetical protein n=1 Tax=Myxococcus sp. RHSTA-1-4 TaxID=2874601 RepID=UPI001CBAF895|nr:hypothetical protein [Myxococcus sp. RHSTA-1-4]MBZ4416899.1 hypothetical protein [Myxococcus sp. RHSTA-1-4]
MMQPLITATLSLALGQAPDTTPAAVTPPEPPVQARLSFVANDADFGASDSLTRLHAALDARTPELTSGLSAEAGVSLFINGGSQGLGFQDNSSFFRLRYRADTWSREEGLALTAYPLSSTRLYMGYEYPVTWARQAYPVREGGAEPALELRLSRKRWSAFAAVKSARVINNLELESERRLALLAGAGVELTPGLRVDVEATTVDRGLAPAPAMVGEKLEVRARGLSGRVQWNRGVAIGPSVDLSLYAGDPAFHERFFEPESYPGGLAAAVSLEGSFMEQPLESPETGEPEDVNAAAAALGARVKWNDLRLHGLAYYRTVNFIQVDVPGLPPFQALAEDSNPRPEVSFTMGADYHLQELGLTPGLLLRATVPAATRFPLGGNLGGAPRLAVLQGPNQLSILPDGVDREPVLTLKATVRWDLGRVAGVLAELAYTRDPNRTSFEDDETGVARPVLTDPHAVGGNLLLQARF